jgi:hypothetical protein
MGLERTVQFPAGGVPAWGAVEAQLARVGASAPLRMIDGMPAFPDEEPDAGWRELRAGLPAGMVTVRRAGDALAVVVWSNADPALLAARDAVAWACAAAAGGMVDGASATDFARACGLSPA